FNFDAWSEATRFSLWSSQSVCSFLIARCGQVGWCSHNRIVSASVMPAWLPLRLALAWQPPTSHRSRCSAADFRILKASQEPQEIVRTELHEISWTFHEMPWNVERTSNRTLSSVAR